MIDVLKLKSEIKERLKNTPIDIIAKEANKVLSNHASLIVQRDLAEERVKEHSEKNEIAYFTKVILNNPLTEGDKS